MSPSFDLEAPDRFTAGAVGPPGERVFYLQGRESRKVISLKCEKEQVRALGEYLTGLLAQLSPVADKVQGNLALLEPIEPEWNVGAIAVGYDQDKDRVVIVANEIKEDEEEQGETATARFHITRAQAAAFAERARELMQAGRPVCPMCNQPKDPSGHICPRSNGHVAGQR